MSPTNQIETVGGRYRLGGRLGHGGMGEVFAAHDLRLDREVALKLLRADLAEQDGMRERVVAEARLAARLTHPHVVGVLDTGEQDGRPFVVMERLSGRTLRDELAGGAMPVERVRDVGLQVLRALAAAHELGIVHRDVKPGNVLDAGVGTWKVADFGIAKWVHADETLTGTGELLGSPSYLAPERIEGQQAGPASDLYAVGVLLYEALCGRKPFDGDDPFALASAIRDGTFEPPTSVFPDADPGIVAVIERAMRRDPAERYESAEAMAAALLGEETQQTDDTTATIVAPVTSPLPRTDAEPEPEAEPGPGPDGNETVPVPRMDQTARLPYQAPPEGFADRRRSDPRGRRGHGLGDRRVHRPGRARCERCRDLVAPGAARRRPHPARGVRPAMRSVIALGIVAILASSCGQSELPSGVATTLQEQVALIRETAEARRPGYARNHLNELVAIVTSRLEQGLIDEGRALGILESAEAVQAQLSLLPRPSRAESPTPPPEGEGNGSSGKDKGKGNGRGNGDEGHGND